VVIIKNELTVFGQDISYWRALLNAASSICDGVSYVIQCIGRRSKGWPRTKQVTILD
jgi:hypothetical protein